LFGKSIGCGQLGSVSAGRLKAGSFNGNKGCVGAKTVVQVGGIGVAAAYSTGKNQKRTVTETKAYQDQRLQCMEQRNWGDPGGQQC